MQRVFMPESQKAREFCQAYRGQWKIGKETDTEIWAINKECDLTTDDTFHSTFWFGYWFRKHQDFRVLIYPTDYDHGNGD